MAAYWKAVSVYAKHFRADKDRWLFLTGDEKAALVAFLRALAE